MKTIALAAALVVAAVAAPAIAQEHKDHAPAAAAAPAAASGKLSVETTPIGDIVKNEKAKAALEKALPAITQFYDQIATMTLSQVAPMSQGAIDDAKLKEIQAEFDKL
jgi:parvulin-like peptidyl-prolyl isomerase